MRRDREKLEGRSLLGQVRAGLGLRGDGEGTVRVGGLGTLWQVELRDRSSVGAWTALRLREGVWV